MIQKYIEEKFTLYIALVTCCVCFLSHVDSGAPGDGDPTCLSMKNISYPKHVHLLMDTTDYIQLLPIDGEDTVWQALDLDNFFGGYTQVQAYNPFYISIGHVVYFCFLQWQQSRAICASKPFVCGHDYGTQNNWMITQHISRQDSVVAVNETYRIIHIILNLTSKLRSPCLLHSKFYVNGLSVYMWETSTQDNVSAANIDNYRFISNVSSGIHHLTVDFSSSQHSGFYLGIRDNGTCMILNHVLVYVGCRATTFGLVKVSEREINSNMFMVRGECVANSEPINETGPLLECSERGEWSVVSGCQCTTHYYMDSSGQECLSSEF